jgi:hypothetical protein
MKKVLFLNPSCLIKYGIRWGFERKRDTHSRDFSRDKQIRKLG